MLFEFYYQKETPMLCYIISSHQGFHASKPGTLLLGTCWDLSAAPTAAHLVPMNLRPWMSLTLPHLFFSHFYF